MNKILTILLIALSISSASSQTLDINQMRNVTLDIPTSPPLGLPNSNFNPNLFTRNDPKDPILSFSEMPVNKLLLLFLSEVQSQSYVLGAEVAEDSRLISFRFDTKKDGDLKDFIKSLIISLGYEIQIKNNVYFISKQKEQILKKENQLFTIYKPSYRDASYLINLIRPIFGNNIATNHSVPNSTGLSTDSNAPPTSATAQIDSKTDILLLQANTQEELDNIISLLQKIDTKEKDFLLNAFIYEVNYNKNDGSALNLLMNLANEKLNINFGSTNTLQNTLKFTSSSLSLIFSTINTDTRFNLISNPYLRIKNNQSNKLMVGQTIPFTGEVSFQNGTPVQSIKQVETGLILNLNSSIRQDIVQIQLDQQISEAIQNNTNTPTISKRQLQTTFSIKEDEAVVLGGLTHTKDTKSTDKPTIFPFFSSKSNKYEKTEIIIFVQLSSN